MRATFWKPQNDREEDQSKDALATYIPPFSQVAGNCRLIAFFTEPKQVGIREKTVSLKSFQAKYEGDIFTEFMLNLDAYDATTCTGKVNKTHRLLEEVIF